MCWGYCALTVDCPSVWWVHSSTSAPKWNVSTVCLQVCFCNVRQVLLWLSPIVSAVYVWLKLWVLILKIAKWHEPNSCQSWSVADSVNYWRQCNICRAIMHFKFQTELNLWICNNINIYLKWDVFPQYSQFQPAFLQAEWNWNWKTRCENLNI